MRGEDIFTRKYTSNVTNSRQISVECIGGIDAKILPTWDIECLAVRFRKPRPDNLLEATLVVG